MHSLFNPKGVPLDHVIQQDANNDFDEDNLKFQVNLDGLRFNGDSERLLMIVKGFLKDTDGCQWIQGPLLRQKCGRLVCV